MRTLATLATLLVGLAFVFWAPTAKADCPHNSSTTHQHCDGGEPPPPAPSNEFRFIGFTDTDDVTHTIDGGQGMLAMHALCQDDFGPDARMCTDKEFWLSPNAEAPAFASSWLHPVLGSSDFLRHTSGNCDEGLTDGSWHLDPSRASFTRRFLPRQAHRVFSATSFLPKPSDARLS